MIYRNISAPAMLAAALGLGAACAPAHDLMPPTGLETGACTHRSRVAFVPQADVPDPTRMTHNGHCAA
jgi:hypothetical protein